MRVPRHRAPAQDGPVPRTLSLRHHRSAVNRVIECLVSQSGHTQVEHQQQCHRLVLTHRHYTAQTRECHRTSRTERLVPHQQRSRPGVVKTTR
jgi:environmental stress-induced protein Ves